MAFPETGMSESGQRETLADLGEEALVERIVEKLGEIEGAAVGPGDDCALIDGGLLLKTDCLVEGVHFVKGTDPELVGRKAMNRVLSDIAAMGGTPEYALVTIASHEERAANEVEGWYDGMIAAGETFGCSIVGGESTRLPADGAIISITMTGKVELENCVTRSDATVGDAIAVTGKLGGSFASGRHLTFTPRLEEARWLVANHRPTAMMDLSDGLGSDLPRLAAASQVGYTIELAMIPVHEYSDLKGAISDGEDYELLMTVPPNSVDELLEEWRARFPELELTVIGEITTDTPEPLDRAWEHFRGA